MLIAGLGLRFAGSGMANGYIGMMKSGLSLSRAQVLDENQLLPDLVALAWQGLIAAAPLLGLTMVAALLAPLAIGGWNMSFEALVPKFSRLNPLEGMKRLFTVRGLIELVKAYAKFLLVGAIAVVFLRAKTGELLGLTDEPLNSAIVHATSLASEALLALAASLGIIAAIDVPLTSAPVPEAAGHVAPGSTPGAPRKRRRTGSQGPHPAPAAGAGAAPHDAGGAEGRRGDHQPDALRGGAAL